MQSLTDQIRSKEFKRSRKGFDPDEVKEWLTNRPRKGAQNLGRYNGFQKRPAPPADGDATDYKRLTDKERHRKLLLANDETASQLIRKTDVVAAWTESLGRIRSELSVNVFNVEYFEEAEADGGIKIVDVQKAKATAEKVEGRVHEALHKPDYAKAKRERLRKVTA